MPFGGLQPIGGPPGKQMPMRHWLPIGQSPVVLHMVPMPPGIQTPNWHELPDGHGMPCPHCAMGGMHRLNWAWQH